MGMFPFSKSGIGSPPPHGIRLLGFAQRVIHTSRSHIPTDRKGQTLVKTNPKTLGDRIKIARFVKGLNQPQLAKLLRVSVTTLIRWEHNQERPTADQFALLVRALDLPELETQQQGRLLGFCTVMSSAPLARVA